MRKLLIKLLIVQVHNNTKQNTKGRGFSKAYRLNPFHPLSYPTFIISVLIGFIMFGVVGFWKEVDTSNPFKWN